MTEDDTDISYLRRINKASHTPEANAKRRESLKRRYQNQKHRAELMRSVSMRDQDGQYPRKANA